MNKVQAGGATMNFRLIPIYLIMYILIQDICILRLLKTGTNYTSGRINTHGKKQFTYGRVDIRAKLPEGKGIWPALWMLGSGFPTLGWPACGEIDMLELLGHEPSVAHGAVHWNSNGHKSRTNSFTLSNDKFSSGFHIFSFTWTPNKLIWMVDKQQFFYLSRAEMPDFPFDMPQFLICNVAVGGNWPGSPDGTTVFPSAHDSGLYQNLSITYKVPSPFFSGYFRAFNLFLTLATPDFSSL